jgi:hypothetical protein
VVGYLSNSYSCWVADHDDGLSRAYLEAIGWLSIALAPIPPRSID